MGRGHRQQYPSPHLCMGGRGQQYSVHPSQGGHRHQYPTHSFQGGGIANNIDHIILLSGGADRFYFVAGSQRKQAPGMPKGAVPSQFDPRSLLANLYRFSGGGADGPR